MDTKVLQQNLQKAVGRFRQGGIDALIDPAANSHVRGLMVESFVRCPPGDLGDILGPALELASLIKKAMFQVWEVSVGHMDDVTGNILKDPRMRNDPAARIEALREGMITALSLGDIGRFALFVEYVADARMQLDEFSEASLGFRKAIEFNRSLDLSERLAMLHLKAGQALSCFSMGEGFLWSSTYAYFENCLGLLEKMELPLQEAREIKAAALIGRVPSYVAMSLDEYKRGRLDLSGIRKKLAKAREFAQAGIDLASSSPSLDGFVEEGRLNLRRITEQEEQLL